MVIIILGNGEVSSVPTLGDALDYVDSYTKLIDTVNKIVYEYDDCAVLDSEYRIPCEFE